MCRDASLEPFLADVDMQVFLETLKWRRAARILGPLQNFLRSLVGDDLDVRERLDHGAGAADVVAMRVAVDKIG
jgi:hypothetical protein